MLCPTIDGLINFMVNRSWGKKRRPFFTPSPRLGPFTRYFPTVLSYCRTDNNSLYGPRRRQQRERSEAVVWTKRREVFVGGLLHIRSLWWDGRWGGPRTSLWAPARKIYNRNSNIYIIYTTLYPNRVPPSGTPHTSSQLAKVRNDSSYPFKNAPEPNTFGLASHRRLNGMDRFSDAVIIL